MKKIAVLLCLLLLAGIYTFGQEFGSIRGTVIDKEGTPLPGVTITLTGTKTAPRTTITSEKGNYRFLNLPVASDYAVKFDLAGFKSVSREKQVISFGRDVTMDITMEQATIAETITVTGQTPVIDSKRTQVGVNITEDMIMSLPNSRNPWVLMAMAPGIMIDREDVGGAESGQQSSYYGHGSSSGDSTWNIDGANITDNSALGSAPAYLSMAGYEELQVNYGNNDIKSQTGGVQLNFITRRGGNKFSGAFDMTAETKDWQSKNIPADLEARGYKGAGVNKVYLYSANFGGPVIKDTAWFYGSYGIQDIGTTTLAGTSDNTWLASGYLKLDAQVSKNTRVSGFFEHDNKLKWGRTNWGATLQAPETVWNQLGPTPMVKGEVEQMFGNFFLNAKVVYSHNVFNLEPFLGKRTSDGSGPYIQGRYYPDEWHWGNIADYGTVRPMFNANVNGNYFAEGFLGADHEIKFGVDYVQSTVSSYSLAEANLNIFTMAPGWTEAWVLRDYFINQWFQRYSGFIQDTMTFGKLAVNVGLRYDVETSKIKNELQPASPWLPQYLAKMEISEYDPGIKSNVLSPRVGLVYDLFGNGKDIIKLNLARYGSQTGYEFAGFLNPAPWAEIDLRWVDTNGDGRVTSNELFGTDWDTGEPTLPPTDPNGWSWYGGFDPANPTKVATLNKYDPNYKTPRLDEASLSYEKEISSDFSVRVQGFYKKRYNFAWDKGLMADGSVETAANWYQAGTNTILNAAYYGRKAWPVGTYRTNQPDAYQRYMAFELVLKKRLSSKWMMDGSFTYMDWKTFTKGNTFNLNSYNYWEGGVVAPQSGGSGITDVFVNSRWMAKLSGLYQFPYGINAAFTFLAREGYVTPTYVKQAIPNVGSAVNLYGEKGGGGKLGDHRLPNFFELNLRVEKVFNVMESATVTLSADAFNALNSNTSLSVIGYITSSQYNIVKRIINPRVFRFGVRFNF
ncbi:MAG: TonB-dependent receptor [Candidatus Aminicenantes bacterium]|nr:TonB-dependent receptor [Candidatus Aminicenantes bacterium]